jgi:hypothetical protein
MKLEDIGFIKSTILQAVTKNNNFGDVDQLKNINGQTRTSKVKKWVSTEVGRLLFCLW